jgi:hypothetical protein
MVLSGGFNGLNLNEDSVEEEITPTAVTADTALEVLDSLLGCSHS